MAINRVRLQHRAEEGSREARRILSLLERPDRLIGLILIGNNFVNILASAIATVLAVRIFGDAGVAIATGLLTLDYSYLCRSHAQNLCCILSRKNRWPSQLYFNAATAHCLSSRLDDKPAVQRIIGSIWN